MYDMLNSLIVGYISTKNMCVTQRCDLLRPVKPRVTQTLSCGEVTVPIETMAAIFLAVFSVGAVRTAHVAAEVQKILC